MKWQRARITAHDLPEEVGRVIWVLVDSPREQRGRLLNPKMSYRTNIHKRGFIWNQASVRPDMIEFLPETTETEPDKEWYG